MSKREMVIKVQDQLIQWRRDKDGKTREPWMTDEVVNLVRKKMEVHIDTKCCSNSTDRQQLWIDGMGVVSSQHPSSD